MDRDREKNFFESTFAPSSSAFGVVRDSGGDAPLHYRRHFCGFGSCLVEDKITV